MCCPVLSSTKLVDLGKDKTWLSADRAWQCYLGHELILLCHESDLQDKRMRPPGAGNLAGSCCDWLAEP